MNFFQKYMSSSAFLRSPDEGGAPAPTPAPGAEPSTPAAPDAGATNSDVSNDAFSGFDGASDDDGLDSIDLGTPTAASPDPAVTPVAPVVPVAPVPAPVAAPAAPVAPVAPVVAASPEGAPSGPPPSEMDTLVQSMDANAKELTDWLAVNAFALTKEEADAFELDAVASVPKLMARVAVNNMKSTMNIVKNLVPKLIAAEVAKITSTQTRQKEAVGEFYSSNPHLNEKDHGALVTKWANAFRAANPSASRKDAIAYVGKAVSFEAGLVPGQAVAAAPRAAPFAPAVPGARAPVGSSVVEQGHAFAGLGMDMDE